MSKQQIQKQTNKQLIEDWLFYIFGDKAKVNLRIKNRRMSYSTKDAAGVIDSTYANSYISNMSVKDKFASRDVKFRRANGQAVHVMVVDIDMHKMLNDDGINYKIAFSKANVRDFIYFITAKESDFFRNIPMPHQIVFTGRGFQFIYKIETIQIAYFKKPLMDKIHTLYKDVYKALIANYQEAIANLGDFHINANIKEHYRVNRNGTMVTEIYPNQKQIKLSEAMVVDKAVSAFNQLFRIPYTFNESSKTFSYVADENRHIPDYRLGDLIFELAGENSTPRMERYRGLWDEADVIELSNKRQEDISRIIELRNKANITEGYRHHIIVFAAWNQFNKLTQGERSHEEVFNEVLKTIKSLSDNFKEAYDGNIESEVRGAMAYHKEYGRLKNATIASFLGLDDSEMSVMTTIFSKQESNKRHYKLLLKRGDLENQVSKAFNSRLKINAERRRKTAEKRDALVEDILHLYYKDISVNKISRILDKSYQTIKKYLDIGLSKGTDYHTSFVEKTITAIKKVHSFIQKYKSKIKFIHKSKESVVKKTLSNNIDLRLLLT